MLKGNTPREDIEAMRKKWLEDERRAAAIKGIILFLLLVFVSCADSAEQKLVGEWTGTSSSTGLPITLIFHKDGTYTQRWSIQTRNDRVDKVIENNDSFRTVWTVNDKVYPIALDILSIDATTGDTLRYIPYIIRFFPDGRLQMRYTIKVYPSTPGTKRPERIARPKEFAVEKDARGQILLERRR